ncbi:MAG: carboxypeptidase-like regulatory domain-containing protein [Gemmatimonadota bacterium]
MTRRSRGTEGRPGRAVSRPRPRRRVAWLVVGAALPFGSCATAPPAPPADDVIVRGRVVDAGTEEALAGALVSVDGTTLRTLTDLDGRYEITLFATGDPVRLTAQLIGYEEQSQPLDLAAVEPVVDFALVAQPVVLPASRPAGGQPRWR